MSEKNLVGKTILTRMKHITDQLNATHQALEYWHSELKDLVVENKTCSLLVQIVWADSSMDSSWKSINDTKPAFSLCKSVGWIVCISDNVVTIAPNKTVCDDPTDIQATATMHIPLVSMQEIAILNKEEE